MSGSLGIDLPRWLRPEHCLEHTSKTNRKQYLRSIKYYRQRFKATPNWLSAEQRKEIREIYKRNTRLRAQGEITNVDHIVPICSDIVCGLEVPWNLEIITEEENLRKSNKWWPNHPFENLDLFEGLVNELANTM